MNASEDSLLSSSSIREKNDAGMTDAATDGGTVPAAGENAIMRTKRTKMETSLPKENSSGDEIDNDEKKKASAMAPKSTKEVATPPVRTKPNHDSNRGYSSSSSNHTSSSSSYTSSDEDTIDGTASPSPSAHKIELAKDFLSHAHLSNVPSQSKYDYLLSKNVSPREIELATKSLRRRGDDKRRRRRRHRKKKKRHEKGTTRKGHDKRRRYSGLFLRRPEGRNDDDDDENGDDNWRYDNADNDRFRDDGRRRRRRRQLQSSAPAAVTGVVGGPSRDDYEEEYQSPASAAMAFPMTVGAVLALLGTAAWRWLNGGDFVLFPPAITVPLEDEVENSSLKAEDEMDENAVAEKQHQEMLKEEVSLLAEKVDNMTTSVDKLVQEGRLVQNRELTNSAMTALRQHGKEKELSPDETATTDSLSPSLLQQVKDYLESPTPALKNTILEQINNASSSSSSPRQHDHHHATTTTPTRPNNDKDTVTKRVSDCISKIVSSSPKISASQNGIRMLHLYIFNLYKNRTIPRYRKIHTNNGSYQNNVAALGDGATELLQLVGFVLRNNDGGDTSSVSTNAYWEYCDDNVTDHGVDDQESYLKIASDQLLCLLRHTTTTMQAPNQNFDNVGAASRSTSSGSIIAMNATETSLSSSSLPVFKTPCTTDGIVSPPGRKKVEEPLGLLESSPIPRLNFSKEATIVDATDASSANFSGAAEGVGKGGDRKQQQRRSVSLFQCDDDDLVKSSSLPSSRQSKVVTLVGEETKKVEGGSIITEEETKSVVNMDEKE